MSVSYISSLAYIGKQVSVYGSCVVLIAGILGDILNIIVFLSLRTFRESSCAFYLTVMSVLNIGQLLNSALPYSISAIHGSDGTESSVFYCKFRIPVAVYFTIFSLSCFCLVTIDQYCATCSRPRLQKFSNIKLARYLVIIFGIFWFLHSIPYVVFYDHFISPVTGQLICTMTNSIYLQYRAYFVVPILLSCLPICLMVLFGSLAYYNIKQMAHYTVPLVRRELDKQLTTMVLVQVIVNFFSLLPYTIMNILALNTSISSDVIVQAQIRLTSNITFIIYCLYYASPFYIYMCVSQRFRRQFVYVFNNIHLERCGQQQRRIFANQIGPQT